jgi:GNAT superfamily N-acetyltransferase
VERDGPLVRFFGLAGRGFVVYRDLGGLEGAELDDLIARQVEVFAARGERFEWKLTIIVAEASQAVVCAAWIRFERSTDFATLWGGATLPEWRRRGIYRATVAYRATLAGGRGFRYLETDASDDSRPILERLGFTAVTTTTPPSGRRRGFQQRGSSLRQFRNDARTSVLLAKAVDEVYSAGRGSC